MTSSRNFDRPGIIYSKANRIAILCSTRNEDAVDVRPRLVNAQLLPLILDRDCSLSHIGVDIEVRVHDSSRGLCGAIHDRHVVSFAIEVRDGARFRNGRRVLDAGGRSDKHARLHGFACLNGGSRVIELEVDKYDVRLLSPWLLVAVDLILV